MSIWTDGNGRDWACRITIETATQLRTDLKVDLLDEESLRGLFGDPILAVQVLAVIHAKQLEAANMTAGDFAELCTATESVAIAAVDALNAALSDFLRRMRRPALAELVTAAAEAAEDAEKEATALIKTEGRAVVKNAANKAIQEIKTAITKASD